MTPKTVLHVLTSIIFLVVLSACAAGKKGNVRIPVKLDSSFYELKKELVALLPVVDRRPDKSFQIDLEKEIRIPSKRILDKKGYFSNNSLINYYTNRKYTQNRL
jgi:hypothetical protein